MKQTEQRRIQAENRVREMIARFQAGQPVYNAEWQEAKSYDLSRMIESDYEQTKEQFRGIHQAVPWQIMQQLHVVHDLTPYPHEVDRRAQKIRAALEAKKNQEALNTYPTLRQMGEAVLTLLEDLAPLCVEFLAIKPVLVAGRKPSTDPTKSAPRTLDNTGTCGICGMNVKRESGGGLYHHRFTIQFGQRNGRCFGTGHTPIELSPKVIHDYLAEVLLPYLAQREAMLGRLTEPDLAEVTSSFRVKEYKGVFPIYANFKKGDKFFEMVRREEEDRLSSEIGMLHRTIADYSKKAANWEEQPLPDHNSAATQLIQMGAKIPNGWTIYRDREVVQLWKGDTLEKQFDEEGNLSKNMRHAKEFFDGLEKGS